MFRTKRDWSTLFNWLRRDDNFDDSTLPKNVLSDAIALGVDPLGWSRWVGNGEHGELGTQWVTVSGANGDKFPIAGNSVVPYLNTWRLVTKVMIEHNNATPVTAWAEVGQAGHSWPCTVLPQGETITQNLKIGNTRPFLMRPGDVLAGTFAVNTAFTGRGKISVQWIELRPGEYVPFHAIQ